jgi:hypothetical protein
MTRVQVIAKRTSQPFWLRHARTETTPRSIFSPTIA